MEFKNLGLAESIVRAVAREGYTHPTPIQTQAIPHVLAGSDLLGCAQTGTGKTAAFALPVLHRLSETTRRPNVGPTGGSAKSKGAAKGAARLPRVLVLAPTRELASQIGESFRTYGHGLHVKHAVIFGGVNQNPQVRAARQGVDILVATPGRLMDLINQRHIELHGIEILILDEADRMLDMGFIPDIRRIVALVPKKRQTLLFSATMPPDIRALAASILHEPVNVQVDPVASTSKSIAQSVYFVPKKNKPALLRAMIAGEAFGRTLVFTRTKHGADKVVKDLMKHGIRAEAIHGNKSQNARTRALSTFKSKSPPVLIATDIASRGIDVDDIAHVINFDMPIDPETYIHRIGRTARAGATGAAVSFCDADERGALRAIERLTGEKVAVRTDQQELAGEAAPAAGRAKDTVHADRRPAQPKSMNGSTHGRRSKRGSKPKWNDSSPRPAPKRIRSSSEWGSSSAERSDRSRTGSSPGGKPRRGAQQRGRSGGRGRAGARAR